MINETSVVSPNDLLSEHRSPVTSSILFRDSQYFRAERELESSILDMTIEYQLRSWAFNGKAG